jgi:hypothetical protein
MSGVAGTELYTLGISWAIRVAFIIRNKPLSSTPVFMLIRRHCGGGASRRGQWNRNQVHIRAPPSLERNHLSNVTSCGNPGTRGLGSFWVADTGPGSVVHPERAWELCTPS